MAYSLNARTPWSAEKLYNELELKYCKEFTNRKFGPNFASSFKHHAQRLKTDLLKQLIDDEQKAIVAKAFVEVQKCCKAICKKFPASESTKLLAGAKKRTQKKGEASAIEWINTTKDICNNVERTTFHRLRQRGIQVSRASFSSSSSETTVGSSDLPIDMDSGIFTYFSSSTSSLSSAPSPSPQADTEDVDMDALEPEPEIEDVTMQDAPPLAPKAPQPAFQAAPPAPQPAAPAFQAPPPAPQPAAPAFQAPPLAPQPAAPAFQAPPPAPQPAAPAPRPAPFIFKAAPNAFHAPPPTSQAPPPASQGPPPAPQAPPPEPKAPEMDHARKRKAGDEPAMPLRSTDGAKRRKRETSIRPRQTDFRIPPGAAPPAREWVNFDYVDHDWSFMETRKQMREDTKAGKTFHGADSFASVGRQDLQKERETERHREAQAEANFAPPPFQQGAPMPTPSPAPTAQPGVFANLRNFFSTGASVASSIGGAFGGAASHSYYAPPLASAASSAQPPAPVQSTSSGRTRGGARGPRPRGRASPY